MLSSSGGSWFWELERVINMKLLDLPLREAIDVNTKNLKHYVGKYDLGKYTLTIFKKDGQLWSRTPGYPSQRLYAEADHKFFYRAFDGQIEFVMKNDKEIDQVIYVQNGKKIYPRKVK